MTGAAVLTGLVTVTAAAACAAWADRSSRSAGMVSRGAALISGWAGLACLAAILALFPPAVLAGTTAGTVVGWTLSIAGAGLAGSGLLRLLPIDGEAGLAAVAAVTLACGLVGVDAAGRDAVAAARPIGAALIAAAALACIARRGLDGWHGPGALAGTAFAASGMAGAARLTGAAPALPMAVATGCAAVGFIALAAAAVLGPRRGRRPARPAGAEWMVVPVLAAAAVLVQTVRGLTGGIGAIGAVLVGVLGVGLAAALVQARRDGVDLGADLDDARARLDAVRENTDDVVLALDADGRVRTANAAVMPMLQRSPAALFGIDISEVAQLDERGAVRELIRDVAGGGRPRARVEVTLAPPATGTAELRLRAVPGGAAAVLADVTDAVDLRERLAAVARYDQMTGLANRAHLIDEVSGWLDDDRPVGVLYLDLEGLKAVNDRFGHAAGDQVLVEVAGRLQMCCSTVGPAAMPDGAALVARVGGDEFVVAVRGARLETAMTAAEEFLAALRPSFEIAGRAVRIGASIGVSATDDGSRIESAGAVAAAALLHRADIAVFAAKQAGRSGVRRWDEPLEERARRKVDIAIGLRDALETGRLVLAYQPIVRLSDGAIVGVEALIRLPAQGSLASLAGLVTPAELVEVAEGTGEIDELGRWVLAEATHQASLWQRMEREVRVNVNMSVRQLSDPGFVEAVRAALAAARLAPDRLVIEITEGQLLGEGDRANDTIRRLRSDGVLLAIDDFGSGYSSLSYLRRMPVKTVKIDRTLLAGVGSDPRATTLVRAVIGAARGLGLQVVCEGIENLAMARLLRDLGAWAGQGFALHGAMSSSDLLDVLDGPAVDLSAATRATGARVSHRETGSGSD
jgi:diguanylate cyclase (GGDEF)-like protein